MTQETKKTVSGFILLFFIQTIMFALLCYNYRAVAKGDYVLSAASDFMIASMSFFVIKRVSKDEGQNFWLWLGYSLGSISGSTLGIWVSKELFKI